MTAEMLAHVAVILRKQREQLIRYEKKVRELRWADTAMLFIAYKISCRANGGLIGVLVNTKLWSSASCQIDPDISAFLSYVFAQADEAIDLSVECRRLKGLDIVLERLNDKRDWEFHDTAELVQIVKKYKLSGLEKIVNEMRAAAAAAANGEDGNEAGGEDAGEDVDDRGRGNGSDDDIDPDAEPDYDALRKSTAAVSRNSPFKQPDVTITFVGHEDLKEHYDNRRSKLMLQIDEDGLAELIYIDQEGRQRMIDREDLICPETQRMFAHVLQRLTAGESFQYVEDELFARLVAELDLKISFR